MTHSRQSLVIAVLLSIVLSVALYRTVRTGVSDAVPGPVSAPRPATIADASEIAQLRQEVFALRHLVRSQEQRPAASPSEAAAPIQAQLPRPEERAEQARRHHEYMVGVEAAFRKEARDLRWSTETTAVIQTALTANQELRPLAGSVECRSQTCRVEITDDAAGVLSKHLPALVLRVGEALPSMLADRVEDGNGGATMVLYFSRGAEAAGSS